MVQVAALWGKMQEAPQRVMASVKGCISGSQAGAVIEWDGSKALAPVVCGDAPADHRHHQQQQHQEGQTHNSAAPTPVSSRPHTPGCPGVAGDRETLQDLHMRLEAPVGQEAVLVSWDGFRASVVVAKGTRDNAVCCSACLRNCRLYLLVPQRMILLLIWCTITHAVLCLGKLASVTPQPCYLTLAPPSA
jgi:hypothetical protein